MIEIRELVKTYRRGLFRGPLRALDGLDLAVRAGEVFGFLGPNGAGKTTTIKVLLGLVRPTAGTARLFGAPPDDPAVRARLGYLPEQPYFYDYLTPLELLDYVGRLHGLDAAARRDRSARLLEQVGLAHASRTPLRKFSKGMLQRIGLAQALINDPELVILDEPMSGLDPMGRRQVRDLILDLRREGRTVFFSSHILSDVETIADRVAMLSGGRLVAQGTLDELLADRPERVELRAARLEAEVVARLAELASAHVVRGEQHLFTLDSRDRADRAVAALAGAGGRLIDLTSHRGTLEDLFVERMGAGGAGRGR